MADNGSELRSIAWTQVFPFLRLFRTFKLTLNLSSLLFGLAAVLGCYLGGRILDGIWLCAGSGVTVAADGQESEVQAYAGRSVDKFVDWKTETQGARQQRVLAAAVALGNAENETEARQKLEQQSATKLLRSKSQEDQVQKALRLVDTYLDGARRAVGKDDKLSADAKRRSREELEHAADSLRLIFTGHSGRGFAPLTDPTHALSLLSAAAGGELTPAQREGEAAANRALATQIDLNGLKDSAPRGPFLTLLRYESRCFAAAVRGVCALHWGLSGAAMDPEPSLLGSIVSAGRGVMWMVSQRPCFSVFYALLHFAIFALFGGAICRYAAVLAARDESISIGEAWRFAWEKYGALILAPLAPAGIFLGAAVVMWVGGLVGAIPWVGELLAGVFYGLALLGGFALAMILIATVLGLHLMWPTIAVEGSDAFDAVSRAVGFVGQRVWHLGFYSLLLLLYGGVSFVLIRLIGLTLLKMTHAVTGAGMSIFGTISSAHTSTFSKLDAMWHMPAWGDLSLLPSAGSMPFWGTFGNAPLDWPESIAAFLIACWVYLIVSAVGAFVVAFFFCGSTQMYFLLRHDVDAVDYDEVFFEEPPIEPLVSAPGEPTAPEAPPSPSEPNPPADPAAQP